MTTYYDSWNFTKQKACFFDLDGTLIKLVRRKNGIITSPWDLEELEFLPEAKAAVKRMKDAGFEVYVCTNKPDLFRENISSDQHMRVKTFVKQYFEFTDYIEALGDPDKDKLYKPNNLMFEILIEGNNIDRSKSYAIGDRFKDTYAGNCSGLTTIQLGFDENSGYKDWSDPLYHADYYSDNVDTATKMILEIEKRNVR